MWIYHRVALPLLGVGLFNNNWVVFLIAIDRAGTKRDHVLKLMEIEIMVHVINIVVLIFHPRVGILSTGINITYSLSVLYN